MLTSTLILNQVPSNLYSFYQLCLNSFIFLTLSIYFDFADSSNTGKSYSWLFFLKPNFWLNRKVKEQNEPFSRTGINLEERSRKLVEREYSRVVESERSSKTDDGLKIINCGKTYTSLGLRGYKHFTALQNVYFNIRTGEVFSLLGHNGAGKTTLINILTGNITATTGYANFGGNDILDCVEAGQVGFCPQHDILWDDLTVEEHLVLYHAVKLLPLDTDELRDYLRLVNLEGKRKEAVKRLSGGMRRRMSILLATIGDPRVLILDEPTTGLDPVNKRFIWKLIRDLKMNRSILLTTHSMDEADFLSDRIGIIKKGIIQCVGTSLELKNLYGEGYMLKFVCEAFDSEKAIELVSKVMPSAKLVSNNGGSIILNLPLSGSENELKTFVNLMTKKVKTEAEKELLKIMKENEMNYTTLEEVFIKINQ